MREKYKNALMWALYGVLFLFVTVFQTVTFGRMRLFGVKLSLIPVTAACIAMHVGGESGAIFGLAVGLFWCLAGAAGGEGGQHHAGGAQSGEPQLFHHSVHSQI